MSNALHVELWADPAYEAFRIETIAVDVERVSASLLRFHYVVEGDIDRLLLPAPTPPFRARNLWKATCFEAFLKPRGREAYREFNFSPSGQWAAYDFTEMREGRAEADVSAPYVRIEDNMTWWAVGATIALPSKKRWELALSAVLEEQDGTKSYWALAHPSADKPDFHDPACFAAHLP